MKIVIGGSRAITHLNPNVKDWIQNACNNHAQILVGDANGADELVQRLLHNIGHQEVAVFCMDTGCRNNVGSWATQMVSSNYRENSFRYFSSKDREMARRAESGLMIWDAKSKGSLSNMIYLLQLQKECLVYFSPWGDFVSLKNSDDLVGLLSRCTKETLNLFERTLGLSKQINRIKSSIQGQKQLDFFDL